MNTQAERQSCRSACFAQQQNVIPFPGRRRLMGLFPSFSRHKTWRFPSIAIMPPLPGFFHVTAKTTAIG
jgi:hypothetical protein